MILTEEDLVEIEKRRRAASEVLVTSSDAQDAYSASARDVEPLIAALREAWRERDEARDDARITRQLAGPAIARAEKAEAALAKWEAWDDAEDEYDAKVRATHPCTTNTPEAHERYATAMKMIRTRRSKHSIVSLVCWLLTERDAALAELAKERE